MKLSWVWVFGLSIVFGLFSVANGQTLFSDDFNRVGSNLGPNWSTVVGTFSTDGAQAVSQSAQNWSKMKVPLGTDDYHVEATLIPPAASNYSGLVVRGDASFFYQDLYAAQIDVVAQKVNLYRRNAGAWTLLKSAAAPGGIAAGGSYKLGVKVFGNNPVNLEVSFQGALLLSYADSAPNRIVGGAPGIQNYNSGVKYDHFTVSALGAPANQPPVAAFSASPASGTAPLSVAFDASASSDSDGTITAYAWDFGDGAAGSGATVSHTYQNAGSYTTTLTVTDDKTAQGSSSRTISAQPAGGGETLLFQDDFNRTGTTLGTPWRIDAGSFSTNGSQAVSGMAANFAAVNSITAADYAVESTLTVPAGSLYSGIVARGKSTGINTDNYNLQIATNGTVNLYRRNASVWTLLRSAAAPGGIAAGNPYRLKLQVAGSNPTTLEVSFQGALLFTFADNTTGQLASGLPGISNYNPDVKYDDFRVIGAGSAGGGNQNPVARFTCTPATGTAPLTTTCDASASSDADGSIATYAWNFGDAGTGSGVTAGHVYQNAGSYTVTLTVTDTLGGQGRATGTITVNPGGGGGAVGWNLATRVPGDLKGIHFVDQHTGWAVGLDMAIFKTTNGGSSWTKQSHIVWKGSAPAILPWAFDVFFLDQNRGWITGWPELILSTVDGGATWVEQKRNPISPKDGRPFNSANYCQTFDADGNCSVVHGVYLRKIQFTPDGQTGFSVGRYRYIYKTTNGGQTWTLLPFNWRSPNWNPDPVCTNPDTGQPVTHHFTAYNPHLFSLALLSASELFIVGGAAGTYNCPDWFNTIAHSADGGNTWDFKVDLDRKHRFFDVRFLGDTGWIVGGGGTILRTLDRGRSWTVMNPGRTIASVDLMGVAFPSINHVWAVGQNGVVVYTPDGGATWEKQSSKTTLRLERVSFIDVLRGWAAGHLGVVPKTISGGK